MKISGSLVMDNLPVEVITCILKYLASLRDRKVSSLVCKLWYEAYQDPFFRWYEVLHISEDIRFKILSDLKNNDRKYFQLTITGIEITESSLKFWERYGPNIKNLSISNCSINEKVFVKVLKMCSQLDSLCLQNCRELFMVGHLLEDVNVRLDLKNQLGSLKCLNLSYNRYLSDATFNRFGLTFPNIKKLLLSGCQISFFPGLYKKYYPEGQISLSGSVLTFPIILKYLENNAQYLQHLSFSDTFIDNSAVSLLAQVSNLKIHTLNLRRCFQLSQEGITKLSLHQKSITCLDVSLCPRVTDGALLAICSGLTNLKSLSVQSCRAITDLGVAGLCHLNKLKYLNISECDLIEGEGILKGICRTINESLEEIYLSHLGNMTENVVIRLAESLPNLVTMDIGFCYNAVTNKSLQSVLQNNLKLKNLVLTMCVKLTDGGLTGMGLKMTETRKSAGDLHKVPLGSKAEQEILREAKLKAEVEEICYNSSDVSGISLKNLGSLQSLDLNGCTGITDLSLIHAFEFRDLRHLDLSQCNKVTEEGVRHLSMKNRTIESLHLGICQNVDDLGVLHIVKNLKRLEVLTLGSGKITDAIVDTLVTYAKNLKHLDVKHCNQVSTEAINSIAMKLPHLKNLQFTATKFDDSHIPAPPESLNLWLLH
ncbi:hypothetical protein RUM44_011223 [Polyplax serrata]|uniref:F-box domain-containing protein n=1 Tax=Polyplax serrata TaxID=468196 RepID=A0ABR1AQY1_POLSC